MQLTRAWWSRATLLVSLLFTLAAGGVSHAPPAAGSIAGHLSAINIATIAPAQVTGAPPPATELSPPRDHRLPQTFLAIAATTPAAVSTRWQAEAAAITWPAYAATPGSTRGRAPPALI
jgi:hypothetical protein